MNRPLPLRFWFETVLSALSGALTLVTLLWPDWIEEVFATGPDAGSGATEWAATTAFVAVTLGLALAAGTSWHKASTA